jgi:hypothetical protein
MSLDPADTESPSRYTSRTRQLLSCSLSSSSPLSVCVEASLPCCCSVALVFCLLAVDLHRDRFVADRLYFVDTLGLDRR